MVLTSNPNGVVSGSQPKELPGIRLTLRFDAFWLLRTRCNLGLAPFDNSTPGYPRDVATLGFCCSTAFAVVSARLRFFEELNLRLRRR